MIKTENICVEFTEAEQLELMLFQFADVVQHEFVIYHSHLFKITLKQMTNNFFAVRTGSNPNIVKD